MSATTKTGGYRAKWYLRQAAYMSMRRLGLDGSIEVALSANGRDVEERSDAMAAGDSRDTAR
jgi:hypothetical protein